MDSKNYLLLARTNAGAINEKVLVRCDMERAKDFLKHVMEASNATTRGEIIEGNRDFIGDFHVKPLYRLFRDKNGSYKEELVG